MIIYFNPNVWGTVSDWCMVIVTTITALYLYKTFKSQREVQNVQQKLFEIERIRFYESIKPVLKYNVVKDMFKSEEKNKSIFTVEITNETNNIAFDVSVNLPERNTAKQIFITLELPRFDVKKNDSPWFVHFLVDKTSCSDKQVTFLVSYNDLSKIRYHQPIFATFDDNPEIHAHNAEVTSLEVNL